MPRPGTLPVICWASLAWAYSFGFGTQLTSHWLNDRGASNTVIGLNHTAYYLGLALAAAFVPALMRRWGVRCAILGTFLAGATLALFPWGDGLAWWFGLRLANGMAGALSLIPLETLLSRASDPDKRTRNFGWYAVALTLGGALGIWAGLHFFQPGAVFPFLLGGVVPLLGTAGLLMACPVPPAQESEAPAAKVPLSRNFLSLGTAWAQGFLEGGMLAFLSLYLLAQGMSADAAGIMMGATLVGVILFQVPVAWLGDQLGRVPVLLGCYAVAAGALLIVPGLKPSPMLAGSLFLFGACSGAMYPLGLALLGDRNSETALARAYSWYIALECVGSQLGAAAMGKARDQWGEAAMFPVALAALVLVLAGWAGLHLVTRRQVSPKKEDIPGRVAA